MTKSQIAEVGEQTLTKSTAPAKVSGEAATSALKFKVSNEGEFRPGSRIPQKFDIEVGSQTYHVHPNATKHLGEYVRGYGPGRKGKPGVASEPGWPTSGTGEFPMSAIANAIESAQRRGLKPNARNFDRYGDHGEYEIGVDTKDNVIYHFKYSPR
jgi:hypothetical protein